MQNIFYFLCSCLFCLSPWRVALRPGRQQGVCSHFYKSICMQVQVADPGSLVRLLWGLWVSDHRSGFALVSGGPCSSCVALGGAAGVAEDRQPLGVGHLPVCLCATIWVEWRRSWPPLGYSRDKVRGELWKCVSLCKGAGTMTTHSSCAFYYQWESRARHLFWDVGRMVRGVISQWTECDCCCFIITSIHSREVYSWESVGWQRCTVEQNWVIEGSVRGTR